MNKPISQIIKPGTLLVLMLILVIIGSFAHDSYLPSFPAISKYFHTSETTVKFTITVYLLSSSLSQLFYGPLSDQHGRRKILLIGITIFLAGSLLCAVAPSVIILIFGRFVQGTGIGAVTALFRAIMRDCFHGRELAKLSSYTGTVSTLVVPLAPIIGGYLQQNFGWRANFIAILIYASCVFFCLQRWLPETNHNLNPTATRLTNIASNFRLILANRMFLAFLAYSTLAYSGLIVYIVISPFLYQNVLGLSPVQYGWLSIFIAPCLALGAFLNSRYVTQFGITRMIDVGNYLMFGSSSVMLLLALLGYFNIWVILVPMMFFVFGAGFVFSNAFAGAFEAFPTIAGSAAALYGCLQILGSSFASVLAAYVPDSNQIPLATILLLNAATMFVVKYGIAPVAEFPA